MKITNRERIGRALETRKKGLYPYVEREMIARYDRYWLRQAESQIFEDKNLSRSVEERLKQDIGDLLNVIWGEWQQVFKKTLGNAEKNLIGELKTTRNKWAHGENFTLDDTYRTLDTIERLLTAISASEANLINKEKQETLRQTYENQAKKQSKKTTLIEGEPQNNLKPWREIVTPHPDVASGNYQQAEFAADLWEVHLDEGSDEYRDPKQFFQRTYLTEGLQQVLTNALLRLSGKGGEPVIELQTNFGGGKTHALLALYHLCLGVSPEDLPGLEPVFSAAEIENPPYPVNTVVIVGNKLSPGQTHQKPDGVQVNTLWGEIAWQLGGKEGYEIVRAADETKTNPGDNLKELFNKYAPCLILIDEWVAYARQLHENKDLPAGDFDTHFTFAQTLSESAKNAQKTLLVVSLPVSDIETGGERGRQALERVKNAIGRVESPWQPASAEESFQIVRRRLFQEISQPDLFVERDAVIRQFWEMYRNQSQDFPQECQEKDYQRRLTDAYPIHPELFDRLYNDWSSIDKFQRTRGVLRLMAKVIRYLWEQNDKSLLILPANVAIGDKQVQSEITHYLEDQWRPIIDKDVDGENSLSLKLDREIANLGRYSACRRVARSIYIGSAPMKTVANRGVEEKRIKLGCTQPGENTAIFTDALRRLTDQATYIYVDKNRYWISTQPNVTRTAAERASQILEEQEPVFEEIIKQLKQNKDRGEFAGIHVACNSSADIPDEENMGVRLVILHPQDSHVSKSKNSPAIEKVTEILHNKGAAPRYCKNLLIFLAPDSSQISNLNQHVSQYLAWHSILKDKEILNLDIFQTKQAETKCKETEKTVKMLLTQTYQLLLIPVQDDAQSPIEWQEKRLSGKENSPILDTSKKLLHEEYLITTYSPDRIRLEILSKYVWNEKNHIEIKTLWKYITNYPYLPRLNNEQVLLKAIAEGISNLILQDNFAYATGWENNQYLGLKTCEQITPDLQQGLLVKPDIAQAIIDAAKSQKQPQQTPRVATPTSTYQVTKENPEPTPINTPQPPPKTRFYGTVKIDPLRLTKNSGEIANEVLQHLTKLIGAELEVTLDINAKIPEGVPEKVILTVTENCRTLNFETAEFETE